MKHKISFLKYFFTIVIAFNFILPNLALAEGMVPTPQGPLPSDVQEECSGKNCGNYTLNDFVGILGIVAKRFLQLSGSLALLAFIIGGVMLILSGGNKERVQKGQQILVAAVVGLVIVFTSWLIISFTYKALTGNSWSGSTDFPTATTPTTSVNNAN